MNQPQFNVMFEGHVHWSLISHGRYHETYSEMEIKDTYKRYKFRIKMIRGMENPNYYSQLKP